ncbi:MAG: endolytic transglycosylase MltG [Deltaproteobacteria bacterium]|nr:endolytic transglycosylase MltG [Deltaproteobacteria bacterium]
MSDPGARSSERMEAGPPSSSGPSSGKGERRRRRRTRTRPKELTTAEKLKARSFPIAVVLGLLLAAVTTYLLVVYPNGAGPGAGKEVELDFTHDEPTSSIVEKLDRAGLVASPRLFSIYVRATGLQVAAGHHLLTDDASPQEIVRRLERLGHAAKAKVIIPEGWNRFDIAKRLHSFHVCTQQAFLDATVDPSLLRELALDTASAEGFLFPATYELPKDSDPKDVVRRLKGEFDKRFAALDEHHRLGRASLESQLGWTRNEIVTLASMVEKEAAVDEERSIIASVFLNRLRDPSFKRKVLQCDPTAGYGCLVLKERVPACAGFSGKITHAVNMDPLNTYSTYVREGLPPGPIANPGIKSLTAVLAPASTKYLYFVARENRRHAFSETLEEHNVAVKDLRDRSHRDQGEK